MEACDMTKNFQKLRETIGAKKYHISMYKAKTLVFMDLRRKIRNSTLLPKNICSKDRK